MRSCKFVIANPGGLHAQTCSRIAAIARRCHCKLSLVVKGRRASARNMVAMVMLTAVVGATVRIEADGPDEDVAIKAIAALLHDGLGERR